MQPQILLFLTLILRYTTQCIHFCDFQTISWTSFWVRPLCFPTLIPPINFFWWYILTCASLSVSLLYFLYAHMWCWFTHTQYGSVPLGIAANKGHTQTVQRLLEARANVNQQNKVICMAPDSYVKVLVSPCVGESIVLPCTLYPINFVLAAGLFTCKTSK